MAKTIAGVTLYDVSDIASALDLSEETVREYFRNETLTGRKIGSKWFITEPNLKSFLEEVPEQSENSHSPEVQQIARDLGMEALDSQTIFKKIQDLNSTIASLGASSANGNS